MKNDMKNMDTGKMPEGTAGVNPAKSVNTRGANEVGNMGGGTAKQSPQPAGLDMEQGHAKISIPADTFSKLGKANGVKRKPGM